MIYRAQIAEAARLLVGRRFKHQGRNTSEGFDCTGVVLAVAEDLGLVDVAGTPIRRMDYFNYDWQPAGTEMLDQCRRRLVERTGGSAAARELGDVLVMRLPDDPTHMAIVTNLNGFEAMVHSYAGGTGRVVEHVLDRAWRSRIAGVFHFPGVIE